VNLAYKSKNLVFGKEYIIPKPLDPRLITTVTPAVAKAAMETGVARHKIKDWDAYKIELMKRMGLYNQLIKSIRIKARQNPKRILFGDANHYNVLKAVQVVKLEGIADPIMLGNKEEILRIAEENQVDITGIPIIDNRSHKEAKRIERYAEILFEKRQRKGLTYQDAYDLMYNRNYFGVMMVETGEADGFLCGFATKYADTIKPALQIVGTNNSLNHIAGMYIVMTKKGPFFFADTTVNIRPEARTIADTTLLTANEVRKFNMVPKIAIVSYSNFGGVREGSPARAREAVEILHRDYPDLIVDGEMQANYAFNKEMRMNKFPFTKLQDHDVNTIIFPNLSSGNIAYKMMQEIGEAEVIGPIMVGIRKPIHVMQMGSSVREIENMAAIAVVDAQTTSKEIVQL
jgi:malate dehydrogenase (oxaloacetate-decarboxylating)(NADP+)